MPTFSTILITLPIAVSIAEAQCVYNRQEGVIEKNTDFIGGPGGSPVYATGQGRVHAISSWGISKELPGYDYDAVGNLQFESDMQSQHALFGTDAVDMCPPFSLQDDDHICGVRVIYSQFIHGLYFHTKNGLSYECVANVSNYTSDDLFDTGDIYMNNSYLSGFKMKAGGVIDAIDFWFTSCAYETVPTTHWIYMDLSREDVGYLSPRLADEYCKDQYGTGLVSWHNEDEYELLKAEIEKRCTHKTTEYWSDCKVYIALQKNDEGNWMWSDGTNCTYEGTKNGAKLCVNQWHPEQPDNAFGNEKCAEMSRYGELNDINCEISYRWDDGFFCAIPEHYNPSPTSIDGIPVIRDRLNALNNTINSATNNTINGKTNNTISSTTNDTINGTTNNTINSTTNDTINDTINNRVNDYIDSANQVAANYDLLIGISIGGTIVFMLLLILVVWLVKKYCCKRGTTVNDPAVEPDSSTTSICNVIWTSMDYSYSHKDADAQLH